jgi:tRNA dimethylallyltransferase
MQKPPIDFNLITILGPTASGKTRFAAELAFRIGGEIISADSRQIYRKMNIGTGKDYTDYVVDGSLVPYHLIDIHEPGYKYNVFEYQRDFFNAYISVKNRGKMPVLCGGTGMYIEAVTKGYKLIAVPVDEELRKRHENKTLIELKEILAAYKKLHNNTDTDTVKRAIRAIEIEEYYLKNPEIHVNIPEIKPIYIGVKYHRETRRQRITARLKQRLEEGMVEEVEGLMREGIKPDDLIYYGLEYKYITLYLTHKLTYEEMIQRLNTSIHQFAKRQMTWFRKMERQGITINWIDGNMPMNAKLDLALTKLNLI